MPCRLSLLFQFNTVPTDTEVARVHVAGWSESFWAANPVTSGDPAIRTLAVARAKLLPPSASIIGFRTAIYDIAQNKLKPVGTNTGKLNVPGNSGYVCDVPQMGLEISARTLQGPNISRSVMRGFPDTLVAGGELSTTGYFTRSINAYFREITNNNWRFLGRDLSIAPANVVSITGNVLVTSGALGATANESYIRLLHVKNSSGEAVTGSFLCTAVAGNSYTLAGYDQGNVTVPSGKARRDVISTFLIEELTYGRVVVRKVGRGFENYRGRASKRR